MNPHHATFRRTYVPAVARAAVAIGADGVVLDVDPTPEKAAVDPLQARGYAQFVRLALTLRRIRETI